MPKTPKIEYDKRILVIQGWIIDGNLSHIIDQQILIKEWCESLRHAKRMRAEAWKRLSKYEVENIEEKRKKKILELEHRKKTMLQQYRGTPTGIRALNDVDEQIIKISGLAVKETDIRDTSIAVKKVGYGSEE